MEQLLKEDIQYLENGKVYHKHHIVPKHAGGTDDASNLVLLTVEEHAFAHLQLYEQYGRWQDKIAYEMLSGQISVAQATKEAQRNYMTNRIVSEETKQKISDSKKNLYMNGNHPRKGKTFTLESKEKMRISHLEKIPANKGVSHTPESKLKNSMSNKNREKFLCEHCNKYFSGRGNLKQHQRSLDKIDK